MSRVFMPAFLTFGLILFLFAGPELSRGSADQPPGAAGMDGLAARVVTLVDADGDGKITPAEVAESRAAARWILDRRVATCDADADGVVTCAEYVSTLGEIPASRTTADYSAAASTAQVEAENDSVPFSVVLDQLSKQEYFRQEMNLLRAEIEDLDDPDTVVTYLARYPTRYARLHPYVSKWVKEHPRRGGRPKADACKKARARADQLRSRTRHGHPGPNDDNLRNRRLRNRGSQREGAQPRPVRR